MDTRFCWWKTFAVMLLGVSTAVGQATTWSDAGGCASDDPCLKLCPDPCCSSACCGGNRSCIDRIGQLIKPSDHCFDDFISPMSNPVFFEDPRTLTEARTIFFTHKLPNQVGSLNLPGGDVQLYALQLRFALSERLSVIAVKDGFVVADIDGGPLDDLLDDGWADVAAGLKYNLYRDVQCGRLLSAGLTYELPIGSQRTLQDIGDGEFHFFASGAQRLWGGLGHYLGGLGLRLPVDDTVQSTSIHWSNHLDVKLTERFYLFTEVVWWHWTDAAETGLPLGVAGQDVFNFASTNVKGNDLVTQNVGVKYKPNGHTELGIAYEFPVSDFEDIVSSRLQAEWIVRF